MEKNHMEIPWHDYTDADSNALIANADLIEKASVIGRVGPRFRKNIELGRKIPSSSKCSLCSTNES